MEVAAAPCFPRRSRLETIGRGFWQLAVVVQLVFVVAVNTNALTASSECLVFALAPKRLDPIDSLRPRQELQSITSIKFSSRMPTYV